jgi:hypothetical protein
MMNKISKLFKKMFYIFLAVEYSDIKRKNKLRKDKILIQAWNKRMRLRKKAGKITAKLNRRCLKLSEKNNKLDRKGNRLRVKGDDIWDEALLKTQGNTIVEWELTEKGFACLLGSGKLFEP